MDRKFETGQAEAEARAHMEKGSAVVPHPTEPVSRVFLDSELARALGHKNVNWSADHKPYVETEPLPNR